MSIVLIILGVIFVFAGIVGCVAPVLPGPPLSYVALILISFAYKWEAYTTRFLIIMGIVTVIITLLDYVLPVYLPRRYGASKYGMWGSALGLIAGMIFFPPWGLIMGAFLGAFLGELIFKKDLKTSLRAGLGVFVGTITATIIKLGVSGVIGFYFFRTVIKGPLG